LIENLIEKVNFLKISNMRIVEFTIPEDELKSLLAKHSKEGKNGDIAKITVEVVKLYFLSQDPNCQIFEGGRNQPDLTVTTKNSKFEYEIKGTEDADISYSKLKVSSNYCYQKLINGMEMIRVTNIRNNPVQIYFLKYGRDFTMKPEPRWSVVEKK
jgi:hypothetical protein